MFQQKTSFDLAQADIFNLPAGHWLDSEVPGLAAQVLRKGLVSYVLNKDGVTTWLGNASVTPLAVARAMARKSIQLPVAAVKEEGAEVLTLRKCWADYQVSRKLKDKTVRNYNQRLNTHCPEWLDLPMTCISREMVHTKFASIRGDAIANATMRTVRALFRFAQYRYTDEKGVPRIACNPIQCLSETRSWKKERRRTRVIRPQQLQPFVTALYSLRSETPRDLILLLLFTGMRESEARELEWQHLDLKTGVIELPGQTTKTGEAYVIPLSDFAWHLLDRRKQAGVSQWVFPNYGFTGPIASPAKACKMVRLRSGVPFSLHDLRRGFVTYGDELEVKHQILKCLINHKSGDETEMYIQPGVERLRRASQQICDFILKHSGMRRVSK